jgi:anti-sigma factor RsiW
MNTERFSLEELVSAFDRYGSDLARWPAADARRAAAALDASEAARRVLAEAHALDALLDADSAPLGVGSRARARILASIRAQDSAARLLGWLARGPFLLRPAALALIPLLIGLGVGVGASGTGRADDELAAEIHAFAFDSAEDYRDAE